MFDRFIVDFLGAIMMPRMEFLFGGKVGYVLDDDENLGILYFAVNVDSSEQFEKMKEAASNYLIGAGYKMKKLEGEQRKFYDWPGAPEGLLFEKGLMVGLFQSDPVSEPCSLVIELSVPVYYDKPKSGDKARCVFGRPLDENDFKLMYDLAKALGIEKD